MRKTTIIRNCIICEKEYKLPLWLSKTKQTCSKACGYSLVRLRTAEKNRRVCQTCQAEFVAHSASKGLFCSIECYWNSKQRRSEYLCVDCDDRISPIKGVKRCRKCRGKYMSSNNHWNWQGGISNNRDIHSLNNKEYREWRNQIFARDNFSCPVADSNCNGQLEAHHILRWSRFPKVRYKINNGITLCHAHHPRVEAEEKRLIPVFRGLVSVSGR